MIFDSYEVFLGKRECDSPSPQPVRHIQGKWPDFGKSEMGVGAEQKVQTNPIVQAVKRKLERSDSAEEANYLLKCLNYPNIFHEDLSQPTTSTTSRSDSLASNIMRKLSVSGLAGLPQRSPGEMRRSARVIHDSLRTVKDYYNSYGLLLQASNATKQRSLFITIRESIPQGGQQHILHLIALSGAKNTLRWR